MLDRQAITLFTEEMPWLAGDDLEWPRAPRLARVAIARVRRVKSGGSG